MKKSALILLALLAVSTESQAGIFRCRRAAKCAPAARPSCQQGATPQMQRWAPEATPQAPACNGTSCPVPTTVAPVTAEDGTPRNLTYPVAYNTTPTPSPAHEPYGFLGWLNGIRSQYGLSMVNYDANLANWASINNSHQNAYGMGHHVMGPARRQNAGMGASTTVFLLWMASPAHRAALLDPSISTIGIANSGAYWTFNAY